MTTSAEDHEPERLHSSRCSMMVGHDQCVSKDAFGAECFGLISWVDVEVSNTLGFELLNPKSTQIYVICRRRCRITMQIGKLAKSRCDADSSD